jgi:hypothetical protein
VNLPLARVAQLVLAVWTEAGVARPCTLGDDRMGKRLATLAPSLLDRAARKVTKRARHRRPAFGGETAPLARGARLPRVGAWSPPQLLTYPHTFTYKRLFIRQARVECGECGMIDVLDIRTTR